MKGLAGKLRRCAVALLGAPAALLALEERAAAEEPSASSSSAIADLDDLSLFDLLNFRVTTASGGVEEDRSLAAANVYAISREEILRQGWRSLAEVLANVP